MKTSKVMKLLNNLSLIAKFAIIFVVCVFIPLVVAGTSFTIHSNIRINDEQLESLNREYHRISNDISASFTAALHNSNVIVKDSTVSGLISGHYHNERDFYDALIERDLKGYYGKYLSPDDSVLGMTIYTDNYTVTGCEILSKINDKARQSIWYEKLSNVLNTVIAVPDEYVVKQGQYDNRTISLVRHMQYSGVEQIVNGYIKIDMNLNKLARTLNNDIEHMTFYFYSDVYKCYIDPQRKSLITYDGEIEDIIDSDDAFIINDSIGTGKYLADWKLIGRYDLSYIKQLQKYNILVMATLCLGLGLISLILVYMIYCSNKRRIELLKRGMKAMISEHFNKITDEPGNDEIAELITSYNYLSDRMSVLINDVYKLEVRNKSVEVEKVKAELKYLQSQINPHFIFNTLSALHIEALKNNCNVLAEHVYCLASVIRRMLGRSENLRPLSEELDFLRQYLELEKFRFRTKFSYNIEVGDDLLNVMLPSMIIQPLVENSCRHGLQGKIGLRELTVKISSEGGILRVTVTDNGKGMNSEQLSALRASLEQDDLVGHIGLTNVYKRLKLYYKNRADLSITSKENEWTSVTLLIELDAIKEISEL